MVRLLPAIKRLLKFLLALENQYVDGTQVGDMSVGLELLADAVPYIGRCNGECVHLNDFWSLYDGNVRGDVHQEFDSNQEGMGDGQCRAGRVN